MHPTPYTLQPTTYNLQPPSPYHRRVQAAKETRELVSTNGNITFAAFEALCRNRGLRELSRESLRAAFDEADADKSDTIDKGEVEKLIATLQRAHAAARSRQVKLS